MTSTPHGEPAHFEGTGHLCKYINGLPTIQSTTWPATMLHVCHIPIQKSSDFLAFGLIGKHAESTLYDEHVIRRN
jgi:hypothetical protein